MRAILRFEDACPLRGHLGLPDMPLVSQEEDHVSEQYFGVFGHETYPFSCVRAVGGG